MFADGEQWIPSSFKATCTKTGEIVPIYHKVLVTNIKKNYKDKFNYFLKNFVKKEIKEAVEKDENGKDIIDPYKLNAYSDYLVISYKLLLKEKQEDPTLNIKRDTQMAHIADCFKRHFNRDILEFTTELK